jgi:hypothetical protein
MASIGGVEVRLDDAAFPGGGAFRVSGAGLGRATVELADGEVVVVDSDIGVAVAFLPAGGRVEAHEAAQQALDVVAYRGISTAALVRAHDECLRWSHDADGFTIQVVVTHEVGMRFGQTADVTERPRAIKPPDTVWTPGLRFFRYSQIADDIFDSYRNVFLAFEALLSDRVTGGHRGEGAWLAHALHELTARGEIDLTRYVAVATPDLVDAFLDEQYTALRCATFHGKGSRTVLLPGSVDDRETVAHALDRLAALVVDLTEKAVGTRRMSGGMGYAGFESLWIAPKIGGLRMGPRRGTATLPSAHCSLGLRRPRQDR